MNSYKYRSFILLLGIISGFPGSLFAAENDTAPLVYVERCGFHFNGDNCGSIAKNVIYFSSDEFLSFTDNWAVGRKGVYKIYMACLDPGDKKYIDGTLSLITVVVAGPGLGEAHDIARLLVAEFSSELATGKGNISHCMEK